MMLIVAAVGTLPLQVVAQTKTSSVPPPVVDREMSVQRGEQLVVPLGIHGGRGEQLEFLIRTKPAKGRLSRVKTTGLTTAAVLYTPPTDESVTSEQFTYAVRSRDGVSVPGTVKIEITEPPVLPPQISVEQETLDFGSVVLGAGESRGLNVKNSGGGVAEGTVVVPAPWRVDGSAEYRLEAGETVSFKIHFHPEKADTYRGVLSFSGDNKAEVHLVAEAYAPFTVTPASLELVAQPGKQTRGGSLQITNRTDEVLVLKIDAGPNLLADSSLTVQPRSSANMAVFADPAKGSQMDEKISLVSASWTTSVKVRAFSVGTLVRFTHRALEFETVEVGKAAIVEAQIENPGSEKAYVRFKNESPFEVTPAKLELPPGGSGSVSIKFLPARPGDFSQTLEADNNGQIASVALKAVAIPGKELPAAGNPSRSAPIPISSPANSQSGSKTGSGRQSSAAELHLPSTRGELTNFRGIVVRELDQRSAVFEWPADWGATSGLKLQARLLSLDSTGKLEVSWSDHADVVFENREKVMRAKVGGLKPNYPHAFRVIATGEKNNDAIICTTQFKTTGPKPWFNISGTTVVLMILISALGALGWWQWKHRRQGSGW